MRKRTGSCLLAIVLAGVGTAGARRLNRSKGLPPIAAHRVSRLNLRSAALPLVFEPNRGQADRRARYLARGEGFTLFLCRKHAWLKLEKPMLSSPRPLSPLDDSGHAMLRSADAQSAAAHRLLPLRAASIARFGRSALAAHQPQQAEMIGLTLVGANFATPIRGEDRQPGFSNYFIGSNPRDWHTRIPHYGKVVYRGVYPGVDLVYQGLEGKLETDFIVRPGGEAKRISWEVGGAEAMWLDHGGGLVARTKGGELRFLRPLAYQGHRRVSVRYQLERRNRVVRLELGRYDRKQKLVIDPVLDYSTYLGGAGGDVGYGIAVDSAGDAYVAGTTGSLNFPTTSSSQAYAGNNDAFVTKFNSSGTGLVYSDYLGGGSLDAATGIAVDSSGDAYVVGYTYSTDFPTTSGAFQAQNAGGSDAFVTKLSPTGSLVYSTYLGGSGTPATSSSPGTSGDDFGTAIAVDSSGDAYVTGQTQSANFPVQSPLQVGLDGPSDAFVSELNPSGSALLFSTYLGGGSADEGFAIAVDTSGNVYVAGQTFSAHFPTQSPLQPSLEGTANGFVTEINPKTSSLVFSTYLGGSGMDSANSLALDSVGSIYVAGSTTSNNFPVTSGAFQTTNHDLAGDSAFIAKLAPGGTQLVYSTYLGGSGADEANGITVDSSGDAYVTGFTESSDFPLMDALQRVLGLSGAGTCGSTVCSDVFVSKFGPSGDLVYSTYLGGSGADSGQSIAVDTAGNAYVTGSTESGNFPVIAGAPESVFQGSSSMSNAFVAKIGPQDAPATALSPETLNFGNEPLDSPSNPQSITLANMGSAPLDITSVAASGPFSQTNTCGTQVPAGGGTCSIQVTFTPNQLGPQTDQVTITDNAQDSPQTITVTGTGVTSAGKLTTTPSSLSFPAETVGDTSPPQTIQLVNTGTTAVTLTSIQISGGYTETDSCGSPFTSPSVLNVGAACTINVTFTPTATGNQTGSLTISDDAANNPQIVSLSGTGNPVFSLSANTPSSVLLIGSKTTTFTITASAPASFTGSVALSCSTGTCSFNPSSITAGQASTLTVSGLAAASSNPMNIVVNGTSGPQTASLALSVFFADFSVSATPPLASVTAGNSTSYTVAVTPINGFNQVVLLSCANLPAEATCTYSPPGLTLNGTTSATASLTVETTAPAPANAPGPRSRGGPPLGTVGLWIEAMCGLGVLMLIALAYRQRARGTRQARASVTVLALVLLLAAFVTACNNYYYGPTSTPAQSGTPPNTYTITLVGRLGNNSGIQRTTTVNLAVGSP